MIQLFDMVGKKVVPSVHCNFIPELKAILVNFPDNYLEVLAYIFYTTCPDGMLNPYVELPEDKREVTIIADLKPTFYLEDLSIEAAIKKCNELYETPTLRIKQGAKMMLDEMALSLGKPLTFGKDGNATDMRGIMKEIAAYQENYAKVENILKEEQAVSRGKAKISYDQKPQYNNSKDE